MRWLERCGCSSERARRAWLAGAVALLLPLGAGATPIDLVAYASLSVTGLEDFESLAAPPYPGAPFAGVVDLDGSSYAERFAGQTLGASGFFDTLKTRLMADSRVQQVGHRAKT